MPNKSIVKRFKDELGMLDEADRDKLRIFDTQKEKGGLNIDTKNAGTSKILTNDEKMAFLNEPVKMAAGGDPLEGSVMKNYDEDKFNQYLKDQFSNSGSTKTVEAPTPATVPEIPQQKPEFSRVSPPSTPIQDKTEDTRIEAKVEDSHPGHLPETIQPYFNNLKNEIGKYGPDQEKQVMDYIATQRGSAGNRVARGGAAFADALMQGVARAGNPNFLGNLENREAGQTEMALNQVPTLQKMQMEKIGATQKIDEMNPASEISKVTRQAFVPLFKKMGYPDSKLNGMSAADIKTAAALMAEYGGKELENQVKSIGLQLEAMKVGQTQTNEALQRKEEAAKALSGMNWMTKWLHPESKILEEAAGLNKTGNAHPQANEALQWAQAHPNDPRSAEIIKRIGSQ